MSDLKLYGISLQVTDTAGYQTFGVMAESKKDAVNRFRRGESTDEILFNEVEVIGLDKNFEIDDVEPYFDWKPEEPCRCTAKDARIAELEDFVKSIANAKIEVAEISGQYGGVDEVSFMSYIYVDKAKELINKVDTM